MRFLLHSKLSEKTTPGMAILADSACQTTDMGKNIVRGRNNNEICDITHDMYLDALDQIMQRFIPSE